MRTGNSKPGRSVKAEAAESKTEPGKAYASSPALPLFKKQTDDASHFGHLENHRFATAGKLAAVHLNGAVARKVFVYAVGRMHSHE